jgi:hypothetical protein
MGYASGTETLDDVLENRLAADLDHRLGEILGEFPHAGSAPSG